MNMTTRSRLMIQNLHTVGKTYLDIPVCNKCGEEKRPRALQDVLGRWFTGYVCKCEEVTT